MQEIFNHDFGNFIMCKVVSLLHTWWHIILQNHAQLHESPKSLSSTGTEVTPSTKQDMCLAFMPGKLDYTEVCGTLPIKRAANVSLNLAVLTKKHFETVLLWLIIHTWCFSKIITQLSQNVMAFSQDKDSQTNELMHWCTLMHWAE